MGHHQRNTEHILSSCVYHVFDLNTYIFLLGCQHSYLKKMMGVLVQGVYYYKHENRRHFNNYLRKQVRETGQLSFGTLFLKRLITSN